MSNLHTLDISSNPNLSELPPELSTCSALVQLICTEDTIQEPPRSVIDRGTRAILTYLAGDVMTAIEMDEQQLDNNPYYQSKIKGNPASKRHIEKSDFAGSEVLKCYLVTSG